METLYNVSREILRNIDAAVESQAVFEITLDAPV